MLIILDNIRSAHNVGSIFRTADAAGCAKIYLAGLTPSPVDKYGRENKKVTKVSLGAEKSVAWEQVASTINLLDQLKKDRYIILALEQAPNSKPLADFSLQPQAKYALVLGNEPQGIDDKVLDKCDVILEIPMKGKKESLNVAVAFGMALWHLIFLKKGI